MKTLPRICRELSHMHAAMIRNPNQPIQVSVFPFNCHFIFPQADWPAWWLLGSLSASSPLCPSLCRPRGSQEGWSFACWLWEPQHASRKEKNAHTAETAIKYSAIPCPKKAMKKHAECMIWPLRVCLLSFPLTAFLNPSVILFFLLSSHGEHLSWRREDPRQVTCKRG